MHSKNCPTVTLICGLVFFLSVTGTPAELYVTNEASYYIRNDGDLVTKTDKITDTYYFRGKESWHVIKRLDWEISTRSTLRGSGDSLEFTGYSQDLLLEKLERFDPEDPNPQSGAPAVLYSNRAGIKKWLTDGLDTTKSLLSNYPHLGGYINSDVHPAYLGRRVISVLEVYSSYAGGAHGISGFKFRTYTLEGEALRVKDLFSNWPAVKEEFKERILEKWSERSEEVLEEKPDNGEKKDLLESELAGMRRELKRQLAKNLGDEDFIFTASKEGVRFNLFFPPYSIGPYVMGGSWLSIPLGEMPKRVEREMRRWAEGQDFPEKLPSNLGYLSQKTRLYGIAPGPEQFTEEFLVAYVELPGGLKKDRKQ